MGTAKVTRWIQPATPAACTYLTEGDYQPLNKFQAQLVEQQGGDLDEDRRLKRCNRDAAKPGAKHKRPPLRGRPLHITKVPTWTRTSG
eukprot:7599449-Pyramimonas_sp.AAC.1